MWKCQIEARFGGLLGTSAASVFLFRWGFGYAGGGSAPFSARAATILGISRCRRRAPAPRPCGILAPICHPGEAGGLPPRLGIVTALQLSGHRDEVVSDARRDIDLVARLMAGMLPATLARSAGAAPSEVLAPAGLRERLVRLMPPGGLPAGRSVILIGTDGAILAALPEQAGLPRSFGELIGEVQVLGIMASVPACSKWCSAPASGRSPRCGRSRAPTGITQVAVVQTLDSVTAIWAGRARIAALLVGAVTLVVVCTGLAYALQADRARAVDRVCEQVRQRLDTALGRGRCGLWDWDIPRGRIYWSDRCTSSSAMSGSRNSSPSAMSTPWSIRTTPISTASPASCGPRHHRRSRVSHPRRRRRMGLAQGPGRDRPGHRGQWPASRRHRHRHLGAAPPRRIDRHRRHAPARRRRGGVRSVRAVGRAEPPWSCATRSSGACTP